MDLLLYDPGMQMSPFPDVVYQRGEQEQVVLGLARTAISSLYGLPRLFPSLLVHVLTLWCVEADCGWWMGCGCRTAHSVTGPLLVRFEVNENQACTKLSRDV
jgi:hypothetical protein